MAFAVRARGLLDGAELLSARYPLGYPALLLLGKALLGKVWLAGRAISVVSGILAVLVVGRWLGGAAGAWLLVQLGLLRYGATAGTDLPALALALSALALALPPGAPRRPPERAPVAAFAVGLLAGAAAMMRYPAAVVIPVALLALGRRQGGRGLVLGLLGLGLVTLPHWGAALLGLGPLLPDPSENAAIGGGGPSPGYLPALFRAGHEAFGAWPARLGLLGLLVGLLRRDPRALALVLWGGGHLLLLGLFFANERLVLPISLAASLGLAFLLPRLPLALGAALLLTRTWPQALAPGPEAGPRVAIVQAAAELEGPFAASSPWFYAPRADGWIEAPLLLKDAVPAGASPGGMPPEALLGWARARGVRHLVLDVGRVAQTYPALRPMLSELPPGLQEVARAPGWRILALR